MEKHEEWSVENTLKFLESLTEIVEARGIKSEPPAKTIIKRLAQLKELMDHLTDITRIEVVKLAAVEWPGWVEYDPKLLDALEEYE